MRRPEAALYRPPAQPCGAWLVTADTLAGIALRQLRVGAERHPGDEALERVIANLCVVVGGLETLRREGRL